MLLWWSCNRQEYPFSSILLPLLPLLLLRSLEIYIAFTPSLLHLLALNGSNNLPLVLASSKLQKPHALPSPRVQFSIGDGYADAGSNQCRFDVCGHIIQSFVGMAVQVSFAVFRGDAIEGVGHVGAVVE